MIFIGEASKLSGVSIKAIRHYEKMGLLPNLVRSGSYRTFTQSDIDLIQLIKEVRNIGFKISEFKQAFERNESWSWAEVEKLVRAKEAQISKEIEALQTTKEQLNTYSSMISECLTNDPECSQAPADSHP